MHKTIGTANARQYSTLSICSTVAGEMPYPDGSPKLDNMGLFWIDIF